MTIIEKYVLRRVLTFAALTLFWSIGIVWTVQVLGRINVVTDSGQSAFTFFKLATMLLPSIVPLILPFAVLIGTAQTLSVMNSDSELVVVSAAGSPRRAIYRPILMLSLATCLISFVVQNVVNPDARIGVRTLLAEASADLLSSVVQAGSFRKIENGLFVQIGEHLPDGRFGRIFVADSRQKDVDLAYYAKEGRLEDLNGRGVLTMSDGVVHRRTPSGELSVIRFASYTFELSGFASAEAFLVIHAADRGIFYLADPDPNDPIYKHDPQTFHALFHVRLVEWLYPLAFGLIALAVAGDARSHRESRIHPVATALIIALLVRWLGFFVSNEAESNSAYIPFIYLVPAVISAIAVWRLANNRSLELPVAWLDASADFWRGVAERLTVLRLRVFGATRPSGKVG